MASNDDDPMDDGFTKPQLAYLDSKFQEVKDEMRGDMRAMEERMLAETQSAAGTVMEHFTTQLKLALEPSRDTEQKVARLEAEELPTRVSRLEAAVFPPRRRG